MREKLLQYLAEMTDIALKYDLIIAEPVEAAVHTYDPKYGPKLYWDSDKKRYVAMTPERELIG